MANSAPWLKYQMAGPWTKYASPPGKENSADVAVRRDQEIGEANLTAARDEHGPVEDILTMVGSIPKGAGTALEGLSAAIEHPLDAVTGLIGKARSAIDTGIDALTHPIDTTAKVGEYLKNVKPQQVGEAIGSMAAGGVAGKAAGALGDVVGPSVKALQKPVSQTVRDLASKGVVTTPGQRGGKMLGALEEKLTSDPVAGESIRTARGKATEQWNRADLNDAIKDAGGTPLPKNRTGRDAIFHAEQQMKAGYDRLLPKMQGSLTSAAQNGVTFRQAITDRIAGARRLDPEHSKILHDIIDDEVIAKFKNSGGYTKGDTIKEIQETLRTESESLRRGSYQDRAAGKVLDGIRDDFSAMLKRENPKFAPELDKMDRAWAKFKTISLASKYSIKGEGAYTPAQKLRAIAAKDKSKDKQRFASGRARGQTETEAIERVLGNTYPDSGTAGRVAALDAIKHPVKALTSGALSAAYSQPVLRALQQRALKRGGPYQPIGASAPIAGAALSVDQNGIGQ